MAKKSLEVEEQRPTSAGLKFMKVLLAILVPILFLLLLVVLFSKLAGINPIQVAESVLPGHRGQTVQPVSGTSADIRQLNQEISAQKKIIKQLQSDTSKKSDQIANLNTQLKQAQQQANQTSSAKKNATKAAREQVYAQTYRNMDPAKAAAVFAKLPLKRAASYMNMLDNNTKASIMDNMTAGKAAQLAPLLKADTAESANTSSGTSSGDVVSTTP
ncbi:MAG: MotE family protein [Sporolactobacillus sp.]